MDAPRVLAFVGCLNRPAPYFGEVKGRGVAVLSLDTESGALRPLSETEGVDNPTFVAVCAARRILYATSEVYAWHEGVVTAYAIDADGGRLTYINKQPSRGSVAAQLIVHPSGRWLALVNYRMGEPGARPSQAVVTYPIEADGGIGPAADSVTHAGSGPDAARQDGPHPHCALATPDGKHLLVTDLGTDQIIVYRFDDQSGQLRRAGDVALPPGSGPRHVVWARPGIAVVSCELSNQVVSLTWDETALRVVATASTLPGGRHGESHAADIQASPDGRFVYASNRGHDSIAVLSIDAAGQLRPVAHRSTGQTPRSFTLDLSGLLVLVACQDGHEITVFRRDPSSGLLSPPVAAASVGSPMCVRVATMDQ